MRQDGDVIRLRCALKSCFKTIAGVKQIYLYDFTKLIMTIFVKKYFQIPGQEERVNETGITLELCLPVSA